MELQQVQRFPWMLTEMVLPILSLPHSFLRGLSRGLITCFFLISNSFSKWSIVANSIRIKSMRDALFVVRISVFNYTSRLADEKQWKLIVVQLL